MNNDNYVRMPRRLTAEDGFKDRLRGEFHESYESFCGCHEDGCPCQLNEGFIDCQVQVSWDTIKRIYAMAVEFQDRKSLQSKH